LRMSWPTLSALPLPFPTNCPSQLASRTSPPKDSRYCRISTRLTRPPGSKATVEMFSDHVVEHEQAERASAGLCLPGPVVHGSEIGRRREGELLRLRDREIVVPSSSAPFVLAEVSKKPAVAFHRNSIFEDLQRLP